MPLDCLFLARIPEFVFGMFFVKVIKKPRAWMGLCGILLVVVAMWNEPLLHLDTLIRTEVVGVVSFLFMSFIFQWFKGSVCRKLSAFVNKYMYGFFLTHHFVQLYVLQKFSGKYLATSDVIVAFLLCLIVTILAMLVLNKCNQSLLKSVEQYRIDKVHGEVER